MECSYHHIGVFMLDLETHIDHRGFAFINSNHYMDKYKDYVHNMPHPYWGVPTIVLVSILCLNTHIDLSGSRSTNYKHVIRAK